MPRSAARLGIAGFDSLPVHLQSNCGTWEHVSSENLGPATCDDAGLFLWRLVVSVSASAGGVIRLTHSLALRACIWRPSTEGERPKTNSTLKTSHLM